MPEKITNLSKFTPEGLLGKLFKKARGLNHLNEQLLKHLPKQFSSLSLCAIENNTATFITNNQAVAFRAQKQNNILLSATKQIDALRQIEKIVIKVDLQEY